ncbi:MAG: hypothetical protein QM779_11420 [Propionicimonas sp.]|uniref:hypothetical protein n=1 Tax=Propionicimonas sp. TaxID=1955623 RepID=UPI003D0EC48E
MATIPVRIRLNKLFCYHGADESDSEPYLWVIAVTIDGRTITHRPDAASLDGAPGFVFSPGSHGSIGGSMGIGANRSIPAAVGHIDTTLQPIVVTAAGHQVEVPGQLALVAILLEEDMTSDAGAEAAHAKINDLLRVELTEAIADIDLDGVGAKIVRGLAEGRTPEAVAREYFAQRMTRVVNRINRYAQDVAIAAIARALSFPAAIVEASDPDNFQGIVTRFWSQTQLEATTTHHRIEIHEEIWDRSAGLREASDYNYNLHGEVWQPIEEYWVPVTDTLPAGRWQVTGIQRTGRKPFISTLGGTLPDGTPWAMPKGKVMDAIQAGTHTFFVRGDTGVEANVLVSENEENPYFPYLATVSDNDPTNNLSTLPACILAIRHTRPAP